MPDNFKYDVFLSHNAKDKLRVRNLAERLKNAGLRVWFDEWVIKAGDDIYLAIERGLEAARVQVLCLSPAALSSDWVRLERSTALFRDPSNPSRRFIPLLLADCNLPDALRRYKYVDLRHDDDAAFHELLAACLGEEPRPLISTSRESHAAISSMEGQRLRPSLPRENLSLLTDLCRPEGPTEDAIRELIDRYRNPLERWLHVRFNLSEADAEDVFEDFITERVLTGKLLGKFDYTSKRFRPFLATALGNFARGRLRVQHSSMRRPEGGLVSLGQLLEDEVPLAPDSPVDRSEVAWARVVVAHALERMEQACERSGRSDIWVVFESRLVRPILEAAEPEPLEALAERLQHRTPKEISNLLITAKRAFQRHLQAAVREYVEREQDVESEIRDLRRILSSTAATGAYATQTDLSQPRSLGTVQARALTELVESASSIVITLNCQIEEFDETRFVEALRAVIGDDAAGIRLRSVRPGSTILDLGGDEQALSKLVERLKSSQRTLHDFVSETGMKHMSWTVDGVEYKLEIAVSDSNRPDEKMATCPPARDQVSISYSHGDHVWLEKLQTMMSPLVRNKTISVWYDGQIKPSEKWRSEIRQAMSRTKVALLLVSPNFLASNFINEHELPYFVNEVERNNVELVWILLRHCLYKHTPLVEYQAAHDASKPLNGLSESDLDATLVRICEEVDLALHR